MTRVKEPPTHQPYDVPEAVRLDTPSEVVLGPFVPRTGRPQFKPQERSRGWLVVVVVVLGLLVSAAAVLMLRPRPVIVGEVVRGTAINGVYATGTAEPYDRVTVKSKLAGTVDELLVREGVRVKKGDLLARLGSRPLQAELARSRAELRAAKTHSAPSGPRLAALQAQMRSLEARLQQAQSESARVERLLANGSVPVVELENARARVDDLNAQLAALGAEHRAVEIDLTAHASESSAEVESIAARVSDLELRAPIDGVVLSRMVELGQVVSVNEPLFRIGDVSNLVIECDVDEADVGQVRVGAKVVASFYAFAREQVDGTVMEIFPDADRRTKNFLVRVRLNQRPEGLRSGMTAELNILIEERPNSLLAPAQAVDEDSKVWVVRNGRATQTAVRVGIRSVARAEILGGLLAGDHVVISGAQPLTDGARVQETLQPMNSTRRGFAPGGAGAR